MFLSKIGILDPFLRNNYLTYITQKYVFVTQIENKNIKFEIESVFR